MKCCKCGNYIEKGDRAGSKPITTKYGKTIFICRWCRSLWRDQQYKAQHPEPNWRDSLSPEDRAKMDAIMKDAEQRFGIENKGGKEMEQEQKCSKCGEGLINGVCWQHPTPHGERGIRIWKGMPDKPDKFYQMGWLQGFPHVDVEVFKGFGVRVTYMMTGLTYSWDWPHKEEAWAYAKGQDYHIKAMIAKGNEYAASAAIH